MSLEPGARGPEGSPWVVSFSFTQHDPFALGMTVSEQVQHSIKIKRTPGSLGSPHPWMAGCPARPLPLVVTNRKAQEPRRRASHGHLTVPSTQVQSWPCLQSLAPCWAAVWSPPQRPTSEKAEGDTWADRLAMWTQPGAHGRG